MSEKSGVQGKTYVWIILLFIVTVAFFSKILFTGKIINASDVITQFFWDAKGQKATSLYGYIKGIPGIFQASWEPLLDGGRTLEGGWNAIALLFYRYLILHFFPFPSSIAWLAVLSLFWSGVGTLLYCRLIGMGRFAAFTASLIFALCTENASLINAGHIQKIEAISWAPWVFFFLESALRGGRLFHYAMAALMLAVQFFTMHWQISFYTCLAVGAYWCFHVGERFLAEKQGYAKPFRKDVLLTGAMVLLFFTTIAMSFAPLVSWSQQSERGDAVTGSAASSGTANAEKGIGYEEGMSWSMPPEEILTFFAPGMFGFSRQEASHKPSADDVYYWGRMHFTQTNDYLGLLPWFLLPLPLFFRRDRYTWFFAFLLTATLIMALGKYTFVYRFMFTYLPAFSKFRVPKMILFLFAFAAAVLAGKGLDVLVNDRVERKRLLGWVAGVGIFTGLLGLLALFLGMAKQTVIPMVGDMIAQPTRYQEGPWLVDARYAHMVRETGIACAISGAYLAAFFAWYRKWLPSKVFISLLVLLLLGDLWRVNERFLLLVDPPVAESKKAKNDVVTFLEPRIDHYRMQPLNEENAHYYADQGFANISAYVTISERRYKEFLGNFNLMSGMPDIVNLKYLLIPAADFESQKNALTRKYTPVFASANGSVVLENKTVLPKAWLVPSVAEVADPQQRIGIMSSDPNFNPAGVALVESPPPFQMAPYGQAANAGSATVDVYTPNRIVVTTIATANSLLVLGEKYYRWWYAYVDGKRTDIYPVDHILRGVYLPLGSHKVEFVFDPLPFKVGKWLTLASLAFFAGMLGREWWIRKKVKGER